MSNTQTITFDDFDHWRKAALVKTEKFAKPKKITVFPTTREGPVADLYPTGEVKLRPQEATGDGQPVKPAWVNVFGAWINAFKELAEIAGRQWGPDWIQRVAKRGSQAKDDSEGPTLAGPPDDTAGPPPPEQD